MISIMYIIIMLIVDISIFATYQSAAKPNRNILLSATIPYEFLKDSKIAEIVKKYKKINLVLFMAAMAVAIPIITIKYVSFVTLYLFLWIFALMFLFSYVFKKYNNQLLLLKREKNWFSGSSHIVSIDTEVSSLLQAIKEPIYMDDDEYWKNGFYNNPSDNRTMVEKRFGYGYTVNMATWKGKIITYGSLLAIAVLLLWMFIMFIRFDFAEFELSFKGDIVQIQAPVYGYSFNVNEIEGVSIIETLPGGGKTNGVGTEQYSLGNFNLNGLGRSKMYVYKDYPPYVLIQLRDIFVIYNTKSADETLKYYELLSNKIE